jgi:hypothetical protein
MGKAAKAPDDNNSDLVFAPQIPQKGLLISLPQSLCP